MIERGKDHIMPDKTAVTQRHTAMILEVATGIDKDTTPDGNILAEVCVERRKHLECFVHQVYRSGAT